MKSKMKSTEAIQRLRGFHPGELVRTSYKSKPHVVWQVVETHKAPYYKRQPGPPWTTLAVLALTYLNAEH